MKIILNANKLMTEKQLHEIYEQIFIKIYTMREMKQNKLEKKIPSRKNPLKCILSLPLSRLNMTFYGTLQCR